MVSTYDIQIKRNRWQGVAFRNILYIILLNFIRKIETFFRHNCGIQRVLIGKEIV